VKEANLDNTHPWIQASWTTNRFYTNNIPTPREDDSDDSSNGRTNVSDSSEEAEFSEYDTDLDGAPYACTLTTRGRTGSSYVTLTVDLIETMHHELDK
jgi:hypothetical protein